MNKRLGSTLVLGFGLMLALVAGAQTVGETVRLTADTPGDVYLFGRSVLVAAGVDGDVVAAGREVAVEGPVSGDVIAAAETLTVSAPLADDLRAAGRLVTLDGRIGGHAVAAGWQVELSQGARIRDWLWAFGSEVRVDGVVAGELKVRAAEVIIGGAIGGDADIAAERVRILPGASFAGDLRIRSSEEAQVPEAVSIGGTLSRSRFDGPEGDEERGDDGGSGLLFWLVMAVFSAVTLLLLPRASEAGVEQLRGRPLVSLALGFAILAAGPLLAVLLLVSGVGAVLGLAVLLVYALVLLAGFHLALSTGADAGLRLFGRQAPGNGMRVLALAAAALLAGIVAWIPWLGPILIFLAVLAGIGASGLGLWRWRFGGAI